MSEGGVGIIGVWHVSAVPVRAFAVRMLVWAGGSDLDCVAEPGSCPVAIVVDASVAALAS